MARPRESLVGQEATPEHVHEVEVEPARRARRRARRRRDAAERADAVARDGERLVAHGVFESGAAIGIGLDGEERRVDGDARDRRASGASSWQRVEPGVARLGREIGVNVRRGDRGLGVGGERAEPLAPRGEQRAGRGARSSGIAHERAVAGVSSPKGSFSMRAPISRSRSRRSASSDGGAARRCARTSSPPRSANTLARPVAGLDEALHEHDVGRANADAARDEPHARLGARPAPTGRGPVQRAPRDAACRSRSGMASRMDTCPLSIARPTKGRGDAPSDVPRGRRVNRAPSCELRSSRAASGLDQAGANRDAGELDRALAAELRVDAHAVGLDRLRADGEARGRLARRDAVASRRST